MKSGKTSSIRVYVGWAEGDLVDARAELIAQIRARGGIVVQVPDDQSGEVMSSDELTKIVSSSQIGIEFFDEELLRGERKPKLVRGGPVPQPPRFLWVAPKSMADAARKAIEDSAFGPAETVLYAHAENVVSRVLDWLPDSLGPRASGGAKHHIASIIRSARINRTGAQLGRHEIFGIVENLHRAGLTRSDARRAVAKEFHLDLSEVERAYADADEGEPGTSEDRDRQRDLPGGVRKAVVVRVQLVDGRAGVVAPRTVVGELVTSLALASDVHRRGHPNDGLDLTYSSVLLALSVAPQGMEWVRLSEDAVYQLHLRERVQHSPQLDFALTAPEDWDPERKLVLSTSASALVSKASELRKRCSPDAPGLDTRHLIGAYLLHTPERLQNLGVKPPNLFDNLIEHVRGHHESELEAWLGLRHSKESSASEPEPSSAWDRAAFTGDRVNEMEVEPERDRLGVAKDAERFAKLFVASDIPPPIALGLFGGWGSGKSFFMGLMKNRVRVLCKSGQGSAYVARVAQIDFNAWHYQDTNLWASMAMRIFEGLARDLTGDQVDEIEERRRDLNRVIHSTSARLRSAQRRRNEAVDQRSQALRRLGRWRELREREEGKGTVLRLKRVWKALSSDEVTAPHRRELSQAAERLGLEASLASAEDLSRLRTQLVALGSRTHVIGAALGARFGSGRAAAWAVLALGLALAVVYLAGPALDALQTAMGREGDASSGLSTAIVQLSALASAGAAWAGRQLSVFSNGLDAVERIELRYRELETTGEPSPEERAAQIAIQRIDARIRRTDEEIADADRQLEEAVNEIRRIDEGGLVYDFLREKQTDSRYRGELGLISTIREDLEQLGRLLGDFRAHGKDAIQRVILYIDDLDRCHPRKVVEVLQAVHLLLAFDLFHVVVGVDPRWVERSLYREYVGETESPRASGACLGHHAFSPQNYLEKIFQIPYSLAPMERKGFGRLVGKLVTTRSAVEAQRAVAGHADHGGTLSSSRTAPELEPAGATGRPGADQPGAEVPGQAASGAGKESVVSEEELERELKPLFMEDFEEEFIRELHGFVNTPRLAKRLVNVYRLLRLRASDEGEVTFPGDKERGEYKAVLTLLAIQIGFPRIASELLWVLASEPKAAGLIELFEGSAPTEIERRAVWARSLPPWNEEQAGDLATVHGQLIALKERATLFPGVAVYARWAPWVGLYSSRWHVIGQGGGLQVPVDD